MTKQLEPSTEAKILDAARRVFTRSGTSGARVQDIAAEAGVNQALIHYYFGSKDALAERVFRESAQMLVRAFTPRLRPEMTLEELIREFVTGYIDAVRQAPFIPGYVLSEAQQHPERLEGLVRAATGNLPSEVAGMALPLIQRLLAEEVKAGRMRPTPPAQLLVNVMALAVFPFLARPVLGAALGFDDARFQQFLDERREELPRFILNALRV